MKVSFRRKIVIALLAVVAAAGVWLGGPATWEAQPASRASASASASREREVAADPSGARPAGEPSLASRGEPAADDFEEHPLRDVIRQVLANDRQLTAFMYYYNRPLLDEAEKAKYHELLSNHSVFAGVKHDLLYPEETRADKPGNVKRLMKIDYLREALEWKDNPAHDELVALVADTLLTDNFLPDLGMDMRLSLSGNKRELYELLDQIAPDRAAAVLQAARGTRQERLFAFIATSVDGEKRLEASAEGLVSPPK